MEQLIKQAELLKALVKAESRKLDNPVLTTSLIIELDNFIEYLQEED